MKRFLLRFVSKLNENNRILFITFVIIFCIISLIIGIYVQFFYLYADRDPFMMGVSENTKKEIKDKNVIKQDYIKGFDNKLYGKAVTEKKVKKLTDGQEMVYNAYSLSNGEDSMSSVSAQIPQINIDNEVIKNINSEIKTKFYDKASTLIRQDDENTMYSVSYIAYINSNILSLVVKSLTKEEGQNERVEINSYVYDIENEKEVSLNELLENNKYDLKDVQKTINNTIAQEYEDSKIISEEYGNIYERNVDDDMYKIENTECYYITNNGDIYIVYAYGNKDCTNEMDIITF